MHMRWMTMCAAAAASAVLVGAVEANSASFVPKWGPVKATGQKARMLTDASAVDISFKVDAVPGSQALTWNQSVRVPSATTTVRKQWTFRGKNRLLTKGKAFPLATVTTTLNFTLMQRGYTERIFSQANFDRYFNVCVKEAKDVTASGGDVYCEVWHSERVRLVQASRIKNLPRPQVISEQDLGAIGPDCVIGATQQKVASTGTETDTYECQDRAEADKADYTTYYRTISATARTWTGKKWATSTSSKVVEGDGPGWIKTATAPLPAPTVKITGVTPRSGSSWTVTGTVSCSYTTTYKCPFQIWVKRVDGSWGGALGSIVDGGLMAGPYTDKAFSGTVYTTAPTTEAVFSDTMPA